LSSFVIAKVAALPLMLLYVFIGASMGTLIGGDATKAAAEVQQIEENQYLIASGILLSFVMIACITRQVKKELNKVRLLFYSMWSMGPRTHFELPTDSLVVHSCRADLGAPAKAQARRDGDATFDRRNGRDDDDVVVVDGPGRGRRFGAGNGHHQEATAGAGLIVWLIRLIARLLGGEGGPITLRPEYQHSKLTYRNASPLPSWPTFQPTYDSPYC
jgi:hypothetical protein